jgi:hypothetical protein
MCTMKSTCYLDSRKRVRVSEWSTILMRPMQRGNNWTEEALQYSKAKMSDYWRR